LMCCITFIYLLYVELVLHSWHEADLVVVKDLSDVLLGSVHHYFIEDFCMDIY
jgi:hypothetical protein